MQLYFDSPVAWYKPENDVLQPRRGSETAQNLVFLLVPCYWPWAIEVELYDVSTYTKSTQSAYIPTYVPLRYVIRRDLSKNDQASETPKSSFRPFYRNYVPSKRLLSTVRACGTSFTY